MTLNKAILTLLECAHVLYWIEGNDILTREISSDGSEIINRLMKRGQISEIAGDLEILAKVLFCDKADAADIKKYLREKLILEEEK